MATIGTSASPSITTPSLPFVAGSGAGFTLAQGSGPGQGHGQGQGQGGHQSNGSNTAGSPSKPSPTAAPVFNVAPVAPAPPAKNVNTDRPIDIRAEEDAARRYNVGRVLGNTRFGAGPRGKRTDLFGPELKAKLDRMAKDHQVSFDEESLAYLSMAAETRLRDILSSSISAQQHRTTSSFLHPPPTSTGSGSGKDRPMWAVSINTDPNALLEAMNKASKEAERDFRTARMDRLAREHEMERIRERAGGGEGSGMSANVEIARAGSESGSAHGSGGPNGNGNGNEADANGEAEESAAGSSPPAPSPSGSGPGSGGGGLSTPKPKSSAPVFGAVQPRKPAAGSTTKKKNPKDVSSDVQIKMSNMTAMRSAGTGKKYSWLNSAPSISSPLSGRKKGKKGTGAGAEGGEEGEGDGMLLAPNGNGKKRKKSKLAMDDGNGLDAEGEGDGEASKRQKRRKMPTLPSRRMVPVPTTSDGRPEEKEKLVPDDRCLTLPDVVFAMERDGAGKGMGMGTGDEVVRKAMARPGGIWGLSRPR